MTVSSGSTTSPLLLNIGLYSSRSCEICIIKSCLQNVDNFLMIFLPHLMAEITYIMVVILRHLSYSFSTLSKPAVYLHEQICESEAALMTEFLLVWLIHSWICLCMNDHDAVCDSVAVSSDSRKTARHPAGLPPTVSSRIYIKQKTYKHTHTHAHRDIHDYITLLSYVADYCMLAVMTAGQGFSHWAGCHIFHYLNRKVLYYDKNWQNVPKVTTVLFSKSSYSEKSFQWFLRKTHIFI